ncbi:hypothetical protein CERZMDRAFT_87534 [Cercospora zeae-maydis SCOH1-5]|uniref:Phytocyanin domain-containing protein n=1 Tax=Cercospora zeae-maydis SCOH1-5 TaxID=717836 RepID=A0A6A6F491_9PEZI|nr:hypothetical protein CERZMDRAFT_87534 [Cercospora zeae-maydis SCOH1-5]
MLSKTALTSAALALAGSAIAQTTHDVRVVQGQLAFEPTSLSNVAEGDSIRVSFDPNIPHDSISGSFANPCQYNSEAGVNSGILTASDGEFVFRVNSTDPSVYYCSVGSHCQAGMAFVVNPSGDNTYEAYSSGAQGTSSGDATGSAPAGGVVQPAGSSNGESSSSAAPTASETSSSGAVPTSSETSTASAPANTNEPTSTGSMPSASSPASQTPGNAASGLKSGLAMVGALAAAAAAFAL